MLLIEPAEGHIAGRAHNDELWLYNASTTCRPCRLQRIHGRGSLPECAHGDLVRPSTRRLCIVEGNMQGVVGNV